LFKIRIIGLVAPRIIEIGRRPVLFVEGELVTTGAIRNLLVTLGAVALATACAQPAAAAPPQGGVSIGRVQVTTIPFDHPGLTLRSATYTPSGKVLVSYAAAGDADPRDVKLALIDDDGKNMRPFFAQRLPERPKDNGLRFMVFADNRRIFTGDYVIECAQSLESCTQPALYPVEYPPEVAGGEHVSHRWSEIIVAPDNRHIAWTTLLSNYSALVFLGELEKAGASYRIVHPTIVSTLDPFAKDPSHPDGVLPQPVRGGEVKQFVDGGAAISLVGAVKRDLPDSVVQHLATGEKEAITDTPGYTETTIFSPDERLGMTMTSRFSEHTDLAVLGLLPRPYPDSLNMGLSMLAYTYSVTGVRAARSGNVGPALIDIAASKTQNGYLGVNLNTKDDWVFSSPMSWHPSGKTAMWLEVRRGSRAKRMQRVRLPDYRPAAPVAAGTTPDAIPYGVSDLAVVADYARASGDIDVKVYGKTSGYISYRRTPGGVIEKTYVDFSDDGRSVYSGTERTQADPRGRSTYTAKLKLTGPRPGEMDLKITFGPLGGELPAEIIFAPDSSGAPLTRGYAEYDGQRLSVDTLAR
jgi:hypothetical protein